MIIIIIINIYRAHSFPSKGFFKCGGGGGGEGARPCTTCGLSLLLVLVLAPRVFLQVLRFSYLCKNEH